MFTYRHKLATRLTTIQKGSYTSPYLILRSPIRAELGQRKEEECGTRPREEGEDRADRYTELDKQATLNRTRRRGRFFTGGVVGGGRGERDRCQSLHR